MISPRAASTLISIILLDLAFSACGGGGRGSTGGGGGGNSGGGGSGGGDGGGSNFAITLLSPSTMMVGVPVGEVDVIGTGFTAGSQVLIDGKPAQAFFQSGVLQVQVDSTFDNKVATHQFSVQNGSQVSNSLPFTVYAPQQGPSIMQALPGFLAGQFLHDATFILAADVDGDGLSDVIMPGMTEVIPGSIVILHGQADGTLSAPESITVPVTPDVAVVGDVDGNGTLDLVSISSNAAASGTTTVNVLLGDGHGNFQLSGAQQTLNGYGPSSPFLADLEGDGQPDLILATLDVSGTTRLVWLKNTGGAFGPATTLTAAQSGGFAVADLNGDGRPDILYVANGGAAMHILVNQGNGLFKDQVAAGFGSTVGTPIVFDFNLDRIPDVVIEVQQPGNIQLVSFQGNGDGSFTKISSLTSSSPVEQLVMGDFDHDGFPDLAGPGASEPSRMTFFFGDGRGDFVAQTVVGPEGQYAATGDFNGDGFPDIVVPDRFSFVTLALGRKDRNFPSVLSLTPATEGQLSVGDVNGDGLPEIFVGGDNLAETQGTVFLNQGNNSFQAAGYTSPDSFTVADLTGKGVVDLIGTNTDMEIWPNNRSLNFSSTMLGYTWQIRTVNVADMDGDGFPDIVASSGQILYGNGNYQFTPLTVPNLGFGPIIGDFNGDGRLDILTNDGVFFNLGNRTFQQVIAANPPLEAGAIVAVADFNGDGKDDVAINLPGSTSIVIYISNGDGSFYQATQVDPGGYPGGIVAGDFDGDGRIDLAVGLLHSSQACLLFNQGNGQFTRSFIASGAQTVSITAADLNHNGKLDLVIGNFTFVFAPPNVDVVFHQ